jgi:hypothetical protein
MNDAVRTNPTTTVTVKEFADVVLPAGLEGLSEAELAKELASAEGRGMDLARRLGVDRSDNKLPAYIWAIVFGQRAG